MEGIRPRKRTQRICARFDQRTTDYLVALADKLSLPRSATVYALATYGMYLLPVGSAADVWSALSMVLPSDVQAAILRQEAE